MPLNNSKKILIIEDDPDQIFMYETEFSVHGFNVLTTSKGSEGIKMAGEERPDIILVDEIMEEMSGLDVVKAIKGNASTKNIPIIIFSNLAKEDMAEKAKELGATDYIVKSRVVPRELVDRVKSHL